MATQNWVWARATIAMDGVAAGSRVRVNTDDPYIAMCVANGYLVVIGPAEQ